MAAKTPTEVKSGKLLQVGLGLAVVILPLAALFIKIFDPNYIVFSNDGPLGGMVAAHNRMPGILTGIWQDLNWLGGSYPPPFPDPSTALRLITSPVLYAKLFAPFSLFMAGFCAWICFRQYKFSPIACLLVAAAATLNSDFVGTAAWGVCSQPIAFGLNFLALGALADTTSPKRWVRVILAGFCVGLGVVEAYDIGALFSMFVGAFVIAQSFLSEGPVAKRIVNGIGRLAVVAVCAGMIAAGALTALIGTQVKGIVGMGQDAESKAARWNDATTYSIPKREMLGMVIPGLFGFRSDTPGGGEYWGRGGSHPSWDEFVTSDGQKGRPGGNFRAGAGSNYAGLLVVLLAVFGIAQSLRKQGSPFSAMQRRHIWFWLAMLIVAVLLMFGRFAPFYQFFYALPYASTIRNPAKFHHVAQWTLLILFAYGAEGLCRVALNSNASVASGLASHWKAFWAKAAGFERKWIIGSVLLVGMVGVGWLLYSSSRTKLENYHVNLVRLQYLAGGVPPDVAAREADKTVDSRRAIAQFSVQQVGRTLLFLVPTVGLIALTLSGYFRGPRVKIGGALLLALLIIDLFPIAREWIVMVNWTQKYAPNSLSNFARANANEHRLTRFPLERLVDMQRLPPQIAQQNQILMQLYSYEWAQHLFLYNDIQCLDVVQEPRVTTEKTAYQATVPMPLRQWELSNTRYILGVTGLLDLLNQQLDPAKKRFRIAYQFDIAAKPGTSGQRLEEITTISNTNGQFAVFEFTGALPRAKLYTDWKVSAPDPDKAQPWLTNLLARVSREEASALTAQSPTDLATLRDLADPAFDPEQTVLLSEPLPTHPGTNQNTGEVKFESYAPRHIILAAKASAPSILLLNDKFDSDWHVTVDGQPAKLLRANYIVRGVFLEKAGDHRIEFRYQPPLRALYVSSLAVLIGLGLLGYVAFTGRTK